MNSLRKFANAQSLMPTFGDFMFRAEMERKRE
jgi:hypothetical protein